ncbi:hypothetical protein TNCV_37761 [Trichonephila clavipes]|nr:hypothetical protein TNCV_37761 [Trichonephila clavipes]
MSCKNSVHDYEATTSFHKVLLKTWVHDTVESAQFKFYHQFLPSVIVTHRTKQSFPSPLESNRCILKPRKGTTEDSVLLQKTLELWSYAFLKFRCAVLMDTSVVHIDCCCYLMQCCLSGNIDYADTSLVIQMTQSATTLSMVGGNAVIVCIRNQQLCSYSVSN